jgi:hypothetical protein
MTPYETYVLFLALKRHFTESSYDAFKYCFKVKTSVDAFERRNDKYFFAKLAKHENPRNFLLAALTRTDAKKVFIGNIIRDNKYEAYYSQLGAYYQAPEYMFESEISALQKTDFQVKSGQHPGIIDTYFFGDLSIETLAILDKETKIVDYWNKNIRDTLIWPDLAFKIRKYAPFVRYDKIRVRKALAEVTK